MKEFLLSLGIFLGIVHTQPDPVLAVRIYRDPAALYLNLDIRDVLSEDGQTLLQAGNELDLVIEIQVGDESSKLLKHRISCDPITREYQIERNEVAGARHRTSSISAALLIFGKFYGLRLKELDQLTLPIKVSVRAYLLLPDEPSLDASVLWNYKKLGIVVDFHSIYEIPY